MKNQSLIIDKQLDEAVVEKTVALLTNPFYITNNIVLAVSKRNNETEDILKKQYLNFDLIMKVFVDDPGEMIISSKVTKRMLEVAGINEEDAWDSAIENSRRSAYISDLRTFLPFPVFDDNGFNIFVGTCNKCRSGASVMYYPEVFEDFCRTNNFEKLFVLPSSTEEVVILPWSEVYETDELLYLVKDINSTDVAEDIQMVPAVYIYDLSKNEIELVDNLD